MLCNDEYNEYAHRCKPIIINYIMCKTNYIDLDHYYLRKNVQFKLCSNVKERFGGSFLVQNFNAKRKALSDG